MRVVFAAVLSGLFLTGCATPEGIRFERVERFQFTDVSEGGYADYRREVRQRLRENWQALLDSKQDLPASSIVPGVDDYVVERIVEMHSPTDSADALCRFADGKPRGMLLLHGLYDSPYIMRDLEAYFRSRCFLTRSILLPGHGTRPGSLLKIGFEDWVEAVDFAVDELARRADGNVYLAGFSTGGALALNSAFKDERIRGLFLFAPALKVESAAAYYAKKTGLEWVPFHRLEDRDVVKYESMTLDSVIAVDGLANKVRAALKAEGQQLTIPVFIAVAENDYTIKSETATELFRDGRFGEKSEMIIYSPKLVNESETGRYLPVYINSRFQHRQNAKVFVIADYSHMALTLKPDDAHYGLEGAYQYCQHYFFDAERKKRCEDDSLDDTEICFGERKLSGAENYAQCRNADRIVRRLTSNPKFDELTRYLNAFIERYVDR